jgi:hypothetical protein
MEGYTLFSFTNTYQPCSVPNKAMEKTIFVQMAAYRDPQLIPTLTSLVSNARRPEDLRIVVCWQHSSEETIDEFFKNGFTHVSSEKIHQEFAEHIFKFQRAQIELIDVPNYSSQGACWARNQIQQHYKGERYTLQLDSHHRFVPTWDDVVIDMLESLREVSPKPALTAYLPVFDPDIDPQGRGDAPCAMHFDRFTPEGVVFFRSIPIENWQQVERPVPGRFYSAHFLFADGSFAEEVQHDPNYFFHGEEISIAARAFTHGYDFYYPHRQVAWHEYTRKGRVKMWDEHTDKEKSKGQIKLHWGQRNDISLQRNRILFQSGDGIGKSINFGKYGFGKVRTLTDYEAFAGLSFANHGVQQIVLDFKPPVLNVPAHANDGAWLSSLKRSNDVRVCLHKSALGSVDAVETCRLTATTTDGTTLHTETLTKDAFQKVMPNDWLDTRMFFISELKQKPATYRVELFNQAAHLLKLVNHPVTG